MSTELAVDLMRQSFETVLWLSAPILLAAMAVSLTINIVQVLTSVQEATISTVPRLASVGIVIVVLAPWMFRRLMAFTVQLFSDFRPYSL